MIKTFVMNWVLQRSHRAFVRLKLSQLEARTLMQQSQRLKKQIQNCSSLAALTNGMELQTPTAFSASRSAPQSALRCTQQQSTAMRSGG